MRPVTQGGVRRVGPVPLGINHRGANLVAIHNDMHSGTHFARTVEGRTRVVGAVAGSERTGDRADVVNHTADQWRSRACCIHGKGKDRRVC